VRVRGTAAGQLPRGRLRRFGAKQLGGGRRAASVRLLFLRRRLRFRDKIGLFVVFLRHV